MTAQQKPTSQTIKDWYNQRYQQFGEAYMRPKQAYRVFLEKIQPQPNTTLLDIACGTGYLLALAQEQGLQTFGVDISEAAVAIAKKVVPQAEISVAAGEKLPFTDQSFDYICCLGSLEHFLDIQQGLTEMQRVAKPTATYCIMVPNRNYWLWKLKGESGTEQQAIKEQLWSLTEWKKLFEQQGFVIQSIHQDGWYADQLTVWQPLFWRQRIKKYLFQLIWKFLPLYYTYQFVFLLKKA